MRIAAVLSLVLGLSASAQVAEVVDIGPGHERAGGAILDAYSARWRQWVTESDGSRRAGLNTITDNVTLITAEDAEKVIVRDLLWESTTGSTYRRIDVMDRKTLAPVRMHVTSSPASVSHVDFDGQRVHGVAIAAPLQPARRTDGELASAAFNWSSDGFLLAGISFEGLANARLAIATNLLDDPSVGTLDLQVLGRERVETIPFGTHETTIVRQTGSPQYWGQYWVSERPPYVVRVQFNQDNGTVTVWELY